MVPFKNIKLRLRGFLWENITLSKPYNLSSLLILNYPNYFGIDFLIIRECNLLIYNRENILCLNPECQLIPKIKYTHARETERKNRGSRRVD